IIFFVGGAIRPDHADRAPAASILNSVANFVANVAKPFADQFKSFFPGRRRQLAVFANERLGEAFFVVRKVKCVAALDAEEIVIDPALVAIVPAHDLHAGVAAANAQRGLASVAAVGADRTHVVHLPRTRLVAVSAGGERTDRANVDAHAALFAVEAIALVRSDDRTDAAVLHAQRPNVHALAADAHAAVAQDAARTVEIHHGRPLLFFAVVLGLRVLRFRGAIGERHILQFAFAAGVAHRAIQRMVAEQQLNHRLAGLTHFIAIGRNDHALANHRRAGGLKLGHLLDLHDAHAAGALQRKPGIVAKRRHFDARALAGLDQQRPRGSRDLFAVDSKIYVSHESLLLLECGAIGRTCLDLFDLLCMTFHVCCRQQQKLVNVEYSRRMLNRKVPEVFCAILRESNGSFPGGANSRVASASVACLPLGCARSGAERFSVRSATRLTNSSLARSIGSITGLRPWR